MYDGLSDTTFESESHLTLLQVFFKEKLKAKVSVSVTKRNSSLQNLKNKKTALVSGNKCRLNAFFFFFSSPDMTVRYKRNTALQCAHLLLLRIFPLIKGNLCYVSPLLHLTDHNWETFITSCDERRCLKPVMQQWESRTLAAFQINSVVKTEP